MGSHQQYLFVRPGADNYLNTSVMSAVCRMVIAEGLSVCQSVVWPEWTSPHRLSFRLVAIFLNWVRVEPFISEEFLSWLRRFNFFGQDCDQDWELGVSRASLWSRPVQQYVQFNIMLFCFSGSTTVLTASDCKPWSPKLWLPPELKIIATLIDLESSRSLRLFVSLRWSCSIIFDFPARTYFKTICLNGKILIFMF